MRGAERGRRDKRRGDPQAENVHDELPANPAFDEVDRALARARADDRRRHTRQEKEQDRERTGSSARASSVERPKYRAGAASAAAGS